MHKSSHVYAGDDVLLSSNEVVKCLNWLDIYLPSGEAEWPLIACMDNIGCGLVVMDCDIIGPRDSALEVIDC